MENNLKPCPICRGVARYYVNRNGVSVTCAWCGLHTAREHDWDKDSEDCLARWRDGDTAIDRVTRAWNDREAVNG